MAGGEEPGIGGSDLRQVAGEVRHHDRGPAESMMRRTLGILALAWMALLPPWASGHEVRPAYLELRQTAEESWSVLWKVPAQGDMRLALHPRFPAGCALASEPVSFQ